MSDDISIPAGPTYRVPRHRHGMDSAAKRRAVIAGCLFGSLIGIAAGWSMFGHRHQGLPVVQADSGPVRVKPANPGGLQVAAAGNEIFSGGNDTNVDKLAPPPETPDLQALRAPPPPVAAVAKPVEAPPAAAAPQASPVVAAAPAQKPVVAAPATPKPAATAAAAEHHAPAPAHATKGTLVQLAALTSEQAAKTEWEHLAKRMPDLLAGKQPAFSKIERDGHTYWRVRTGGFTDSAEATVFCVRLRAKGANCSVADF